MKVIKAKSTTIFKRNWNNDISLVGKDENGKPIYDHEKETYILAKCTRPELTPGFKNFKMELRYYYATDIVVPADVDLGTEEQTVTKTEIIPSTTELNYCRTIDEVSFFRSQLGVDINKEDHLGDGLWDNTRNIFLGILNQSKEFGLSYELIN